MTDLDKLFLRIARSSFRSRFHLTTRDANYLKDKGLVLILDHARTFITQRLGSANPNNDGRQTPMKNHPAFIAQHATATCCRKCLAKWHDIPQNTPLTDTEITYLVTVIERWLCEQMKKLNLPSSPSRINN